MCRTGGPRCPKEALRILNNARVMYDMLPDDPQYKAEFLEAVHQYQLTRKGINQMREQVERLQKDPKTNEKRLKNLKAKISAREWERSHLLKREECTAWTQKYANVIAGDSEHSQRVFRTLLSEGEPLPRPTRAAVSEWMDEETEMEAGDKEKAMPFSGAQFYALKNYQRRLASETVVDSVQGITELDPPGSQRDQYVYDENGEISEVYYSSYGSNMNTERFLKYVKGGKAGTRHYQGCRDKTEPSDAIPVKYPHPLFYAMKSRVWEGGIAFLDHSKKGASLGKAYKVSGQQFKDVVAQESGGKAGDYDTSLNGVVDEGIMPNFEKSYGTILHVGDHNGRPVFTFTSFWTGEDSLYGDRDYASTLNKDKRVKFRANSPSHAYVHTISKGLHDEFGLDKHDAATYFSGQLGAHEHEEETLDKYVSEKPKPKPKTTTGSSYTAGRTYSSSTHGNGAYGAPAFSSPQHNTTSGTTSSKTASSPSSSTGKTSKD